MVAHAFMLVMINYLCELYNYHKNILCNKPKIKNIYKQLLFCVKKMIEKICA